MIATLFANSGMPLLSSSLNLACLQATQVSAVSSPTNRSCRATTLSPGRMHADVNVNEIWTVSLQPQSLISYVPFSHSITAALLCHTCPMEPRGLPGGDLSRLTRFARPSPSFRWIGLAVWKDGLQGPDSRSTRNREWRSRTSPAYPLQRPLKEGPVAIAISSASLIVAHVDHCLPQIENMRVSELPCQANVLWGRSPSYQSLTSRDIGLRYCLPFHSQAILEPKRARASDCRSYRPVLKTVQLAVPKHW
nr:hypothetical protein CFP56_24473 [Quercus suber]